MSHPHSVGNEPTRSASLMFEGREQLRRCKWREILSIHSRCAADDYDTSGSMFRACSRKLPDGSASRPGSAGRVVPNWFAKMSLINS